MIDEKTNARPIEIVLELERDSPGSQLGVGSGYASAKALQRIKDPAVAALMKHFREELRLVAGHDGFKLSSWANVMRKGQATGPHDHVRQPHGKTAEWAGVSFLTEGSALVFPQTGRRVVPVPGLTVIFPATEVHLVESHDSDEPRISIAVNAIPE